MTRVLVLSLLGITVATPGCSLARGVSGSGADAGTHVGDTFVARIDTGVDAAAPPIDMGVVTSDMGVDMGTPATDAGNDAAVLDDAGGCRGDLDCPPTAITSGSCTYPSECATMAMMMQTTTSYTCVDHVCVMHTAMASAPCTRTTDGTACGTAVTCSPCSATSCGDDGMVMCMGHVCMTGTCAPNVTSTTCTTPDDMCGTLTDWGACSFDGIGSSTCHQTRAWGQCTPVGCAQGFGHSESRACTCPHFP